MTWNTQLFDIGSYSWYFSLNLLGFLSVFNWCLTYHEPMKHKIKLSLYYFLCFKNILCWTCSFVRDNLVKSAALYSYIILMNQLETNIVDLTGCMVFLIISWLIGLTKRQEFICISLINQLWKYAWCYLVSNINNWVTPSFIQ